jgi:GNAT superfamily N-acetyltransferase
LSRRRGSSASWPRRDLKQVDAALEDWPPLKTAVAIIQPALPFAEKLLYWLLPLVGVRTMVHIEWCRDDARARALAKLFTDNLTDSYISHGELQGPRALAPGRWVPNIAQVLEEDLRGRIRNADDPASNEFTMLAAGLSDGVDEVGVMLATFSRAAAVPYCILEDIVIRTDRRNRGYGRQALDWLDRECQRRGIHRLFLESGVENKSAHELFERDGFKPVSVVMMKSLNPQ